jgi:hypothetical protein
MTPEQKKDAMENEREARQKSTTPPPASDSRRPSIRRSISDTPQSPSPATGITRLEGTTWVEKRPDGGEGVMKFMQNRLVEYKYPSGQIASGTYKLTVHRRWQRSPRGSSQEIITQMLQIEIDNGRLNFLCSVYGNAMRGRAHTSEGQRWSVIATRRD